MVSAGGHPGRFRSGRPYPGADDAVGVFASAGRGDDPTRQADDLIAGHWSVLTGWGSVPRALVWDGEAALSSRKGGKAKLTDAFEAFRGMLGIKVIMIDRPAVPDGGTLGSVEETIAAIRKSLQLN